MARSGDRVDVGVGLRSVFRDPHWKRKVLIGGAISAIPILGWMIVNGFHVRIIQKVSNGDDACLPEWDDFVGDAWRGFKVIVAFLVYLAPLMPLPAFSIYLFDTGRTEAATNVTVLYSTIGQAYVFGIYFICPLFIGQIATRERFIDAFRLSAMVREGRRMWQQLLIYAALMYLIWSIAGLGVIFCFLGIFFSGFIALAISGNLIGQIRREIAVDLGGHQSPGPQSPVTT